MKRDRCDNAGKCFFQQDFDKGDDVLKCEWLEPPLLAVLATVGHTCAFDFVGRDAFSDAIEPRQR